MLNDDLTPNRYDEMNLNQDHDYYEALTPSN
jgi:hypothetical protein